MLMGSGYKIVIYEYERRAQAKVPQQAVHVSLLIAAAAVKKHCPGRRSVRIIDRECMNADSCRC
jgi:hypothetical protein